MMTESPTRPRVRRCVWTDLSRRCPEHATKRVRSTYLGQPTDHDVLMCDEHAERAPELLREGWAIAAIEPLEAGATR